MKIKSNLPPGALPSGVRIKDGVMRTAGDSVALTLEQVRLVLIEMGITGELKEQMHKAGILPLKENNLTLIAKNMATVIMEAHQKGTDLKAAFIEAGILPKNPKHPSRATSTSVK